MSRPKNERAKSRVGQVHLCAMCVDQADNAADGYAQVKKVTWMVEIPPESDTYVQLGGRPRTWFCRECFNATCAADSIFRDRNAHLELQQPEWWHDPATERQIAHLANLLDKRTVPEELREEIKDRGPIATKGDVSHWVSIIETLRWRPRGESNEPTSTSTTVH